MERAKTEKELAAQIMMWLNERKPKGCGACGSGTMNAARFVTAHWYDPIGDKQSNQPIPMIQVVCSNCRNLLHFDIEAMGFGRDGDAAEKLLLS